MQGAVQRAGEAGEPGEFFIPDLCASRSVLLMVLLAQLLVIVHVLARSSLPEFNWQLLATGSFTVHWIVLLSAALLCLLRAPLARLSLPLATLCCLLVVALVTVVSTFGLSRLPEPFAAGEVTGAHIQRNVLVALVVAAVLLRYFYLQQQLRQREKLELQSRLDSLRDRIRPHFLFNTLNSIASLIMSRPEAAEKAVEDLSELFRLSLQDEQRSTTVADELHVCELYLRIEKLRLGERLRVDWQLEEGVRELPMPSLVLQPLVENAIYHGVSTLPEGGTVRIAIELTPAELVASVENPVSTQSVPSGGHNIALANIRDRLEVIFGPAGRIDVSPGDEGFRVQVRYPLEAPA
ncbi:MAG: sensor histidine kinase [Halioglobus sp.]|nr:sensor histidine kinase [Halioglobus sp.]